MATFLRGDIHGDIFDLLSFIKRFNLGEGDNIIVLGDCGIAWRKDRRDLDQIIEFWNKEANGVKLYFLDGNHENFNILKSLPIENNMGKLSDLIFHLRRGQVYNFENKRILVCGGADSVDKARRIEGLSWWKDEAITQEDIDGIPAGYYDYVLTHCCPRSVFENNKVYLCTINNINQDNVIHDSEDKLEELKNKITFGKWVFGHYHVNKQLDNNFKCLFSEFMEVK